MTTITIQTTVAASRARTWEAYTQPQHITGWNFASDDWQCPSATSDLRPGGKYSARMEAKDGSFGFDFEATFNEVTEGESLSYTIADGRPVEVRFEGAPEGPTTVTTSFAAENQHPVEMQRDGWQAILDNFRKYAEKEG